MKKPLVEISVDGRRRLLAGRDKKFLLDELLSNAWDADKVSRVDVSLTPPDKHGHSVLTVIDNCPTGWGDLTDAYTMYAESSRRGDAEKRGRFNMGEKDVLIVSLNGKLTTVSGQQIWDRKGRWSGRETRKIGSEWMGIFELTQPEFDHICTHASTLIPPTGIVTFFNDVALAARKPLNNFMVTLPLPLGQRGENSKMVERKTHVTVYERLPGEKAHLFELGVPVVELLGGDLWHVNIGQKIPQPTERDNVPPSYLHKVRVAVYNAKFNDVPTDVAGATWITDAMGGSKITDAAITHAMKSRHGEEWATRSTTDKGSKNEAVSKGYTVVERNSLPKEVLARLAKVVKADGTPLLRTTKDVAPTDMSLKIPPSMTIPPTKWSPAMRDYAMLVEKVAPLLIKKPITVRFIDENDVYIQGCFNKGLMIKEGFKREFGVLTVNLAIHDIDSAAENYFLLIHELSHNRLYNNDHLDRKFYDECTSLGARLTILAVEQPRLFGKSSGSKNGKGKGRGAATGAVNRVFDTGLSGHDAQRDAAMAREIGP
jgi:hypothetical protein